jgi:glyoxylase I family protein
MTTSTGRPALGALHHLAVTVDDVEASAEWYERVLGLQRLPVPIPHHGDRSPGFGVLLLEPSAGWAVGLHHHQNHRRETADETRTGMDHLGLSVPERRDLDEWAARLDELGVDHSGVTDMADPIPHSTLVFRDPDNIQLEFIHLPS